MIFFVLKNKKLVRIIFHFFQMSSKIQELKNFSFNFQAKSQPFNTSSPISKSSNSANYWISLMVSSTISNPSMQPIFFLKTIHKWNRHLNANFDDILKRKKEKKKKKKKKKKKEFLNLSEETIELIISNSKRQFDKFRVLKVKINFFTFWMKWIWQIQSIEKCIHMLIFQMLNLAQLKNLFRFFR